MRECLQNLHCLNTPKLSEAERNSCESLLTNKECWEALSAMKNGKSPGNDGFTKEFYMCFLNEICNQLVTGLNESFTVGQLSTSQCQTNITLIEKKAKDKRFIKNWRPVSLVNVDAKIASKVLASRMKNIFSSIVKCDQTTYVKGRDK